MDPRQAALNKIALRCRWDLFYLAKHILHYDLLDEEVHGDVCKYAESLYPDHPESWTVPSEKHGTGLEDEFHAGNTNLLFLLPRGSLKTTLITISASIQATLNDPNIRILLDSETFSKSKAFLAEIKGHYEGNEELREVFKAIHGVYPNEGRKKELLWSDSQINLACRTRPRKEPTYSCAGIDVTKNGMHYDLAICDDLHSETNVTNKEQIDKVKNHWKLIYSLLDPGRPLILIGTRWHFDDLYQLILDDHREEFNILVRRAIVDGKAWFPGRLSLEELKKIRNKQGSAHFSRQYQNEPIDDDTATFKHKDFKHLKWEQVKDIPINWYLIIDPSYMGQYSDYAAFVIGGMDYQRNIYFRHVTRRKMTYSDIINHTFELWGMYPGIKQVGIETIGAQKSIMFEFTNEQKRRGTWLPINEIKQRTISKEERIRGLAPFYEYGHAYHVSECPQLDELEYELLKFPYAKNDDVSDAAATLLEIASPANAKSKQYRDSEEDPRSPKRSLYVPRSKITGY